LRGVLQVTGIPECFCGFVGERLILCDHAELVSTAWDFGRINEEQQAYLKTFLHLFEALQTASDLRGVASAAGQERLAYAEAFSRDPLLPRRLWPRSYRGHTVEQRHARFRSNLRARIGALLRT
jgi:DNA-binding transcriptional regulator PaaX